MLCETTWNNDNKIRETIICGNLCHLRGLGCKEQYFYFANGLSLCVENGLSLCVENGLSLCVMNNSFIMVK